MNGIRLLAWLGITATCSAAFAAELVPAPAQSPAEIEDASQEQWQYHEKWHKAQQRGLVPATKGAAPANECRPPASTEPGTVRPTPVRCPARGSRVRT